MTAKRKPPRPTIAERAVIKICPNCGDPVERKHAKGPFPTFCPDKSCKVEHFNRHVVEGRAIIVFAKAWRRARGSGEIGRECLTQMCAILDQFNAADIEKDRPHCDIIASKLLATKTTYFDRQKR